MSKKPYCPIKNSECGIEPRTSTATTCFIAIPFKEEMVTTAKTIIKVLRKFGIQYYLAKEDITAGQDILCKICHNILQSDFGVVEATYANPNVMIEFGMLLALRKPVFILLDESRMQTSKLPADIVGLERVQYKNQEKLSERFAKGIRGFVQRLNIEERQLQSLIELARFSANRGDLASVDSLLQAISDKLEKIGGMEDRFASVLQEISVEFKRTNNLVESIRYGLAGVRTFLLLEKRESALDSFDKMFHQLSDFAASARENADDIVNPKAKDLQKSPDLSFVSEDPLGFYDVWLDKVGVSEFRNLETAKFFYAHLWYGLRHSGKPESWMKKFIDIINIPLLKDPLPWFDINLYPWHGYIHNDFFLILWLIAVTLNYKENKKALDIAQDAIDEIRNSVDKIALNTLEGLDPYDWYKEYLRPALDLRSLLDKFFVA